MPLPQSALPFVGRSVELHALAAKAARLPAVGGSAVQIVTGPAGVGKTRLARELVSAAGLPAVFVRTWDDSTPMWPWAKVLERCGRTPPAPGLDRLTRFEAMLDCFVALGPMLVCIDDIHAADIESILFARFLARSEVALPAMILLTSRPPDEIDSERSRLLEELAHDGEVTWLEGLTSEDVATLVDAAGRDAHNVAAVQLLHDLTGGLPLVIEQVLATPPGASDSIGIDQAVRHNATMLNASERQLLATAASFGAHTTIAQVVALGGCSESAAQSAAAAGARARLSSSASEFQFVHELVREQVATWLLPHDRLDVHVAAADLLSADASTMPLAAHHATLAAAISPSLAPQAIDLHFEAMHWFASVGALEQALAASEAAVQSASRAGVTLTLDRRLAHANAALRAGRLSMARSLYQALARDAEAAHEPAIFADAAAGLGGMWLGEHRVEDERRAVLDLQRRAMHAVQDVDSRRHDRLRMRIAAELAYDSQQVEEMEAIRQTIAGHVDPVLVAEALAIEIHAKLGPRHALERVDLAEELADVAAASQDPLWILIGQCWRAISLELVADAGAERARRVLQQRCDTLRCASVQFILDAMAVGDLISAGRFDVAESAALNCFQFGQLVGDADAWNYYSGHILVIRYLQGRHGELADLIASAASSPNLAINERGLAAAAGLCALRAGDIAAGRHVLDDYRHNPGHETYQASNWLAAMCVIAELAHELDNRQVATEMVAALSPYAHLPAMISVGIASASPTSRALGLALMTCGRHEEAIAAFEQAIELAERWRHPPATALARAGLAQALQGHDRARATAEMKRAVEIADSLAMTGWAAEWHALLDAWMDDSAPTLKIVRRSPQLWTCALGSEQIAVNHRVGVAYLAALCAKPNVDIDAVSLAYAIRPSESVQPVADSSTVIHLGRRMAHLRAMLDNAPDDLGARLELDALSDELERITGFGDRQRIFANPAERARSSVTKAITRAISDIGAAHAGMGEHLRRTIRTGSACSYRPT